MQIYAAPGASGLEDRKLIGFGKVRLAPSATTTVQVNFPAHVFDHWASGWTPVAGEWTITLAEHSFDEGKSLAIQVG